MGLCFLFRVPYFLSGEAPMNKQEKDVLRAKYGHCKFLFFLHLFARYVKDAFRRRAQKILKKKSP